MFSKFELFFPTILIVLFFGFPVSPYPIQPHAISIRYTKICQSKPIKPLKSRFSFKVGQHGQQQLNLQYKVCWMLHKMIGLLAHTTTLTISIKNLFLHYSQLLPHIWPPCLLPKPWLRFPPILPPSVTQQLLSSFFLHTATPTIFFKTI